MNRRQFLQRRITLRLRFYILNRNRIQRDVGNGVTGLINHIGPAVFPHLNSRYNLVQKSLMRDKIDHTHDGFCLVSLRI